MIGGAGATLPFEFNIIYHKGAEIAEKYFPQISRMGADLPGLIMGT